MELGGFGMSNRRRRRVRPMNKVIIALLATLVIVPTTLCIVLAFRVSSLQNEMEELLEKYSVSAGNQGENQSGVADSETTTEQNTSGELSTEEDTTEESTETTSVEPLPDGKYAYLTFDDGPSSNTEKILDILDQYNVKATFFVNGHTGEVMEERYKAIVERGHALGIHTYSHQYDSVYGGVESFANEVESLRKYLYDITGVDVRLFRFPGGSSTTIVDDITPYIQWINDNGYSYHDWNCSNGDAENKSYTVQQMVDNCMVQVEQGYKNIVILMHDTKSKTTTVEALPQVIEKLIENGYEIRAIDERAVPVHHREIEKQTD